MWTQPLILTLQLMLVSVTVAAVIGIIGAWAASCLESAGRTGRWISRAFLASMVIALAIPMILHAAAWEATAGKFGWLMMTQTGARGDGSGAYGRFSGLFACGWIHSLFGSALVVLATWYGTRQTPAVVLEQSSFDRGPVARWWLIQLPIASPWLVAALLATASLAATEMTVVDLYGFQTLADVFYLYFAVDPSLPAIVMTLVVPLVVVGSLASWLVILRRRRLIVARDARRQDAALEPASLAWQLLCLLLALLITSLIVLVPVIGLLVKVGHEVVVSDGVVQATWTLGACVERLMSAPSVFAQEYLWTAIIAVASGMTAVLVGWPLAAWGRTHRGVERTIDLSTILLIAIPGPIVGLVVVSLFQLPVPGFRELYRFTIVPTLLALLVRAAPAAYWILRSGYRGIGESVFDSACLDATPLRRFWLVDRPLVWRSAALGMLVAAVVAAGDVPATLPIIPAGVSTVGTRLFGLLHSGARYQEAALAIWYVAAIVAIALIWLRPAGRASDK